MLWDNILYSKSYDACRNLVVAADMKMFEPSLFTGQLYSRKLHEPGLRYEVVVERVLRSQAETKSHDLFLS